MRIYHLSQGRVAPALLCVFLAACASQAELPEPTGTLVEVSTDADPAYPDIWAPVPAPVTAGHVGAATTTAPFLVANTTPPAKGGSALEAQVANKIASVTDSPVAKNGKASTSSTLGASASPSPSTTVTETKPVAPAAPLTMGIAPGETLEMAISRWAAREVKPVLYDASPEIRAALALKQTTAKHYSATFEGSVAMVSEELAQRSPKLRFWVSRTPSELIVHDLGPRTDVRSMLINQPTLRDAAFAVAREIGWKTSDSWTTATPNYRLAAPYRMVVSGDVIHTMKKLLAGYNVQAQFDKSTQTVYFTPLNKG